MQLRQLSAMAVLVVLGFSSAIVNAQPQAGGNNDLVVSLYNQLEALQQEVQTLRGVVEEQGYQLKRLQTEQRDRYLDIDRRLSAMAPAAPLAAGQLPAPNGVGATAPTLPRPDLNESSAAANSATTVATVPPLPEPTITTPSQGRNNAATSTGNPQDEQEIYRTALNLLLQESKYDESIALFQSYIDSYPEGRWLTNALYWQGEAYLLVSGFTQARDVFTRLLSEYPQDAKAAGAMLKLGDAYKKMGETDKAAETWREIKVRYPESANEIRLSEEYLRAL
ncbi:MAG: tol-pal system protein YbgF [Pseudomonadota bacterium]